MCGVLGVHRSGYYVWQRQLVSARKREDDRLLGLIKHHWLASGGVYGYRKVTVDMRGVQPPPRAPADAERTLVRRGWLRQQATLSRRSGWRCGQRPESRLRA